MGADNHSIGGDWRGWGVRAGLASVMAATGMVLAGHAAQATTTATEAPTTQADGGGEGLPVELLRLDGGNSGATCGGDDGGFGGAGGSAQGGVGVNVLAGIGVLGTGSASGSGSANVGGGAG